MGRPEVTSDTPYFLCSMSKLRCIPSKRLQYETISQSDFLLTGSHFYVFYELKDCYCHSSFFHLLCAGSFDISFHLTVLTEDVEIH